MLLPFRDQLFRSRLTIWSARVVAGVLSFVFTSLTFYIPSNLSTLPAIEHQLPGNVTPHPTQAAAGYEVTLLLPPDGLVAGEEMQVEFRVEDTRDAAGRRPVRFAVIQSRVDMPGMPGMAPFEELAHREGVPGVFGVHPTFGHGGDYLLRLSIEVPSATAIGGLPDKIEVRFPLSVSDVRDESKAANQRIVKRFELRMRPESLPAAGTPVVLEITVLNNFTPGKTSDGKFTVVAAPVREFDELHEKLLHLFIVRDDLGTFAHEHPALEDSGAFRLRYAFPTPGRYRVFVDVAPKHAGSQILTAEINVSGSAPDRFDIARAFASQPKPTARATGMLIDWQWPEPLPVKKTTTVTAVLQTDEGRPVADLEPYLGALGHLMLVHEDGLTFVHSHPDDRPRPSDGATNVSFLARFPKPGLYRAWAQFQRAGQVHTTSFIVRVGTSQ